MGHSFPEYDLKNILARGSGHWTALILSEGLGAMNSARPTHVPMSSHADEGTFDSLRRCLG